MTGFIDVMKAGHHPSRLVVLVVEDDPLLRELAVEVVEEAGFVALDAGDAGEAVALLESRPEIALLFTGENGHNGAVPTPVICFDQRYRSDCAQTEARRKTPRLV